MNEFKETKIKPGMCLQQLWELEKDVVFCLVTSVGQRKKNFESPWGIKPQTFGIHTSLLWELFLE